MNVLSAWRKGDLVRMSDGEEFRLTSEGYYCEQKQKVMVKKKENIMAHRINERNTGNWSLDSEPKHVRTNPKKVSRSFTESEIEMFNYFMNKIADNIQLDASDLNNQVYRDNGDILIQFSHDRIEDVRSLLTKFQNG